MRKQTQSGTQEECISTLLRKHYAITACADSALSMTEIWTADSTDYLLVGNSPLELLGLHIITKERGKNWQTKDDDERLRTAPSQRSKKHRISSAGNTQTLALLQLRKKGFLRAATRQRD